MFFFGFVSEAQFHSTQRRVETQFATCYVQIVLEDWRVEFVVCIVIDGVSMHNTTVFFRDFKRFIQLQIYISIRGEWQGLGTCRYYRINVIDPSFSSRCPKEAEHQELICRFITYSQKHIWFDLSHWGLVTILQFDQQKVMSYRYHSLVRESLLHVSLAIITYLTYLIIHIHQLHF